MFDTKEDLLDFLRKLGVVALDDQGLWHTLCRLLDDLELLLTLFAAGKDDADATV